MAPPSPYFGNPYVSMGMGTPNLMNPGGNPLVDEALRKAMTPVLKDVYNNPQNILKGAATAPFTMAPDLLGMIPGVKNPLTGDPLSGDPIRQLVGLDPKSPAGIMGEFMDPTSTAAKGVGLLADLARYAPDAGHGLLEAMTLFHGTPHRFNKFDFSKIGSGEGAQAYGYGLYFAEDPKVAGHYKKALARGEVVGPDGKTYPAGLRGLPSEQMPYDEIAYDVSVYTDGAISEDAVQDALMTLVLADGDKKEAFRLAEQAFGFDNMDEIKQAHDLLEIKTAKGHLYEVDIPDEYVDQMLDWDARLSEQPESVKSALANFELLGDLDVSNNPTGKEIYEAMQYAYERAGMPIAHSKRVASDDLRHAGIPGIKFFDGSSRYSAKGRGPVTERAARLMNENGSYAETARILKQEFPYLSDDVLTPEYLKKTLDNKATRNIVAFSDDIVEIKKRNGKPITAEQLKALKQ